MRRYVERMPNADSDGVSIHYDLAGTGDALVLIGGLGVHTGEYRPLIDALARHHRVLAADNRGAGSSDKPDEPYSYAMMAADTLAAMDAAGLAAADRDGGHGMRRQLDAARDYDVTARLTDVHVPALVLHGRRAAWCPSPTVASSPASSPAPSSA